MEWGCYSCVLYLLLFYFLLGILESGCFWLDLWGGVGRLGCLKRLIYFVIILGKMWIYMSVMNVMVIDIMDGWIYVVNNKNVYWYVI